MYGGAGAGINTGYIVASRAISAVMWLIYINKTKKIYISKGLVFFILMVLGPVAGMLTTIIGNAIIRKREEKEEAYYNHNDGNTVKQDKNSYEDCMPEHDRIALGHNTPTGDKEAQNETHSGSHME